MKTLRLLSLTCVLSLFSLWALPTLNAQPSGGQQVAKQEIQQKRDRKFQVVEDWRHDAKILTGLTVAVGFLGLLAGVLPASQRAAARVATVGVGLAVGTMTLISNTFYPVDYRTYQKVSSAGHYAIGQVDDLLAAFDPTQSEDNITAWKEQANVKLARIDELEQTLERTEPVGKAASALELMATANAASLTIPAWLSTPPQDTTKKYYVGESEDASLDRASSGARAHALGKAVQTIVSSLNLESSKDISVDALRDYLRRNSKEEDTYFEYHRDRRTYTYHTLISINNAFLEKGTVTALVRPPSPSAPTLVVTKSELKQGELKVLQGEFQENISVYLYKYSDLNKKKCPPPCKPQLLVFPTDQKLPRAQFFTPMQIRGPLERHHKKPLYDKPVDDPQAVKAWFTYEGRNYRLTGRMENDETLQFEVYRQ